VVAEGIEALGKKTEKSCKEILAVCLTYREIYQFDTLGKLL
jgi:hypothetical protein